MSAETSAQPVRRADAERNRDRILAVARAAFAGPEPAPSMAEISRRAGVGMATLYRNFPGRRELLEALYTDEVDVLCAAAQGHDDEPPAAVFVAWVHRFFAFSTNKRQIAAELLAQGDETNPVFGDSRTRVLTAGRSLLAAAQQAHQLRADLTVEQVLDLVVAIATIHGEPGYREPILDAALAGLRPLAGPS